MNPAVVCLAQSLACYPFTINSPGIQKRNREAAGCVYTICEVMLPASSRPWGNLAVLQETTPVPSFLGLVGYHPSSAMAPLGLHFLMSKGGERN